LVYVKYDQINGLHLGFFNGSLNLWHSLIITISGEKLIGCPGQELLFVQRMEQIVEPDSLNTENNGRSRPEPNLFYV
jgi:hypothetical protein